ncbi:MAG: hypothetical protein LBF50_08880 [Azoarcus sp.]|jgi:hypothetical protein|nr:hypothetical protein [Azoarcus sp.]
MEVKLLRPHTHGGRHYPEGALIKLRPDQAQWLIAVGVAQAAPETAAKKEK